MITPRQIRLLEQAIEDAATWRGNLVGAAPQEYVDEFDRKISAMHAALREVRGMRRELLAIRRATK